MERGTTSRCSYLPIRVNTAARVKTGENCILDANSGMQIFVQPRNGSEDRDTDGTAHGADVVAPFKMGDRRSSSAMDTRF